MVLASPKSRNVAMSQRHPNPPRNISNCGTQPTYQRAWARLTCMTGSTAVASAVAVCRALPSSAQIDVALNVQT